MGERSALTELIRRARRRQHSQLAMRGIAGAMAVILGGCALLLVTGMPRYGPAWAVAILGAAIAAGLWRMWDGIGDEYSTARLVDRRLGLNDAVSTAVFFENAEGRAAVEFQRRAAEEAARKADAARALPYAMPRAAYACGALVVLCASLVGGTIWHDARVESGGSPWRAFPGRERSGNGIQGSGASEEGGAERGRAGGADGRTGGGVEESVSGRRESGGRRIRRRWTSRTWRTRARARRAATRRRAGRNKRVPTGTRAERRAKPAIRKRTETAGRRGIRRASAARMPGSSRARRGPGRANATRRKGGRTRG